MADIFKYLNEIVPLIDSEITDFNSVIRTMSLKKGDIFLDYGKVCTEIAFIQDGILEMIYNDGTTEKMLDFLFQNSFATNYVSFLLAKPSEIQIRAIKDSNLLCIDKKSLESLYDKNIKFQKIGRLIAENYYIEFAERIRSQFLSPKDRYEKLQNEYPELIQQIPQYKIASYLGVSAEWLSKIRSKR